MKWDRLQKAQSLSQSTLLLLAGMFPSVIEVELPFFLFLWSFFAIGTALLFAGYIVIPFSRVIVMLTF